MINWIDHFQTMNPLVFAGEKSDIELGIFGTGAHSDYGLLTLLVTDDVPGLQVHDYLAHILLHYRTCHELSQPDVHPLS